MAKIFNILKHIYNNNHYCILFNAFLHRLYSTLLKLYSNSEEKYNKVLKRNIVRYI